MRHRIQSRIVRGTEYRQRRVYWCDSKSANRGGGLEVKEVPCVTQET